MPRKRTLSRSRSAPKPRASPATVTERGDATRDAADAHAAVVADLRLSRYSSQSDRSGTTSWKPAVSMDPSSLSDVEDGEDDEPLIAKFLSVHTSHAKPAETGLPSRCESETFPVSVLSPTDLIDPDTELSPEAAVGTVGAASSDARGFVTGPSSVSSSDRPSTTTEAPALRAVLVLPKHGNAEVHQATCPSLASCVAACFGWRLVSHSFDDDRGVGFALQLMTSPAVRATVRSTAATFQQIIAHPGNTPDSSLGVDVNNSLMSFSQCAAHLFELSRTASTDSPDSNVSQQPALDSVEPPSSPAVQCPSLMSPNSQVRAAKRRAVKRARSVSPSPHAHLSDSGAPGRLEGQETSTLGALAELVASMSTDGVALQPSDAPAPHLSFSVASEKERRALSPTEAGPVVKREPMATGSAPRVPALNSLMAEAGGDAASPAACFKHPSLPCSPTALGFASPLPTSRKNILSSRPSVTGHRSATSFSTTLTSEKGDMTNRRSNLWASSGKINELMDVTGWSTTASQQWLARTHAVSRVFERMPCSHSLLPIEAKAPMTEGVDAFHAACSASSYSSTASGAAALVRALLRQRWRERSSIWAAMESSLCASVASKHLRGDALEAAVQALRASEEEQRRYGRRWTSAEEESLGGNRARGGGESAMSSTEAGGCRGTGASVPVFPPAYPAPLPRAFLPVSGRAVDRAQHRITQAMRKAHARDTAGSVPRYTVCAEGIPFADRLAIDNTFSIRGSFLLPLQPTLSDSRSSYCLPRLERNLKEDLHNYVYKYVMPMGARETTESVSSTGVDGNGIESFLSPVKQSSNAMEIPLGNSVEEDEEDNECGDSRAASSPVAALETAEAPLPAVHLTSAEEGDTSLDMDLILRSRSSIRRVPMPDVESHYGP